MSVERSKTDFSGGITDDPRKITSNEFIVSKHFDIFSQPNKLIPYRSLETDTNDGSSSTGMKQYKLRDFLYPTGSGKLYALGQTGAGLTKIVYKADATTGNYTLPASSEGNGAVQNGCLVEYKDYAWGFQGTNQVFKWGLLSGTPTITNTVGSVGSTITSVAQGIIAKDDNLYLPYNNVIARVSSAGTLTDAVLTLPTNFKITSLFNYGNYLGIACAPVSIYAGVSKIYLWNLTSPDVQESIDWGEGSLRVADLVGGQIVGISDRYLNNAAGAGKGSLLVQVYSGNTSEPIKEIFTAFLTGKETPLSKAVKNNRLFFSAKIMTSADGSTYDEGIYSFGRKNAKYPYALTLDIIDENVATTGIQAFGNAANYFFIAHSLDGSVDKTDDAANYTFTSIFETSIENFGDAETDKSLESIKVSFDKLATGQSLTVKLKVDDATSWTTIGTFNTVGEISRTFVNIESSGVDFPSGKEYKLRLESTGGLQITGHKMVATPNFAI